MSTHTHTHTHAHVNKKTVETMSTYDPNIHDDPSMMSAPWADPVEVSPTVLKRQRFSWSGKRLLCLEEAGVSLDAQDKPVNPHGPHNGQVGRGVLGRWGPNHAADPVITRGDWKSNTVQVLVVYRADQSGLVPAMPGGMTDVDPNTGELETMTSTLQREVVEEAVEEASAKCLMEALKGGTVVYSGYAVDPRNTRNAWIETCAVHVHLDEATANGLCLKVNGTEETKGAAWMDTDEASLSTLYAGHATYVRAALQQLAAQAPEEEEAGSYGICSVL